MFKFITNPDEAEAWFDKEIEKLVDMDVTSMLGKMK
jgi:hypothetical protein